MTRRKLPSTARGFTLLELLALLPVMAALLLLVFWGFSAQLSVHKRIAAQADRHAVMRVVLNQMRRDFGDAVQFELETPTKMPVDYSDDEKQALHEASGNAGESLCVEVETATLRLTTADGDVVYRLIENAPLYEHPNDTTQRLTAPPEQRLVRVDAAGEVRTWSMHGQILSLATDDARRVLRVRFTTRLSSDGTRESLRHFETSLLPGGAR